MFRQGSIDGIEAPLRPRPGGSARGLGRCFREAGEDRIDQHGDVAAAMPGIGLQSAGLLTEQV